MGGQAPDLKDDMPQAHDIGRHHYWHTMRQEKTSPLYQIDVTQEIEPPFRKGSARVFRVPLSQHTLVVGTWTGSLTETDALMAAIRARETDYESGNWS